MIRSHRLSLGFALLVASSATIFAQDISTDAAITEAVRRDANTIVLHQKLASAQEAQQRGDLPLAAKFYEESWKLVQSIGPNHVGPETEAAARGLAHVSLALAKDAQRRQAWDEADTRITRALKVEPNNAEAIEMKRANDKIRLETRGTRPSRELMEQVPIWQNDQVANATKVQNAKLLYENGKYDEAEAILRQVLEAEPGNYAAAYYSSLIKEKRDGNATMGRAIQTKERILQVEKAWEVPTSRERLPVPNPYAQTNLVYTSQDRQAILNKLDRIRLDSIQYDGLPLSEVVRSLSEETRRRDPDKQGINFFIAPNADTAAVAPTPVPGVLPTDPTTGLPTTAAAPPPEPVDMSAISVKMYSPVSNIKLQHLLEIIVMSADRPIKYSIQDYGITFTLRAADPVPLYTRTFRVDPNTFWMGLQNVESISFGDSGGSSGGGGGGGRL